jgi:hypothetical protein
MSNRKLDQGDRNPALQWHAWPVEAGACRASSRFGIAAYVARPALEGIGFDLYRAGRYLGWYLTTGAYQRHAEDIEATFAAIHLPGAAGRRKNV